MPPPIPAPSRGLLTAQPQTLHAYLATPAPTAAQLAYANKFFARAPPPTTLWTTPHFRSFPASSYPEVCFVGRSNVGKSSLLNALVGRVRAAPAHVSARPGRTRTMNAFAVGRALAVRRVEGQKTGGRVVDPGLGGNEEGVLVVLDMPGYGGGSREEWGPEILKVLEGRKQLRRTFVLVDAEHGIKEQDRALLRYLAERGIGHQVVLSKVDKIIHPRSKAPNAKALSHGLERLSRTMDGIRGQLVFEGVKGGSLGDILSCSAEKKMEEGGQKGERIGIDAIRWAMLSACGLECDENGLAGRRQGEKHAYPILESL